MSRSPIDLASELQRHGQALRELAASLVRDANVADDAVQQVWLAALEQPPRHAASFGGWLAAALQNVVRVWRRGERRRERRERLVGEARGNVDRSEHVEREARARQLLSAVESLDAPFRDAIWARFFEGKAPRAIASASGVPLATVKSRLQRGLGMLRARLGEGERDGERGDWRRAFAVAFGLEEGTAVAIAAGGVLVATWTKVALSAAAAVVVATWWLWLRDPATTTVDAASGGGAAVPAVAALDAVRDEPKAPAVVEREAVAAPAMIDPKLATIRGRCVDGDGRPVAGVDVRLHAWERNASDTAAWLVDHERLDWQDPPPLTSTSDGTFTFTFAPLPPYQFMCDLANGTLAVMRARWSQIAAGSVIDAGDVVMVPGALLCGRVIDGEQRPRGQVGIDFDCPEPRGSKSPFVACTQTRAFSSDDGSFRSHQPVPDGVYRLRVIDRLLQLREPASVEVVHGRAPTVTVVVAEVPASELIRGKVVDETDAPIADARVEAKHASEDAGTRRDGTFALRRDGDNRQPRVQLTASAGGFETSTPVGDVAWGTNDVVIRLARAGDLLVRALDAAGQPVPRFTVRLFQHAPGRSTHGEDPRVRVSEPDRTGVVTVAGIQRGSYCVIIEFPAASGLQTRFEMIEYTGGLRRLDVRAEPPARRVLRVIGSGGTAVAGTQVQLCEQLGEQVSAQTLVSPRLQWFSSMSVHKACVIHDAVTDAEGRCSLSGPAGVALGLCVRGPGHVPLRRSDVRLDVASELVITVATGGTLRGKVVPAEAVAELVRLERAAADGGFPGHGARVRLRQGRTTHPLSSARDDDPAEVEARVRPDGTFAMTGVPPGDWVVEIVTFGVNPVPVTRGRSGSTTAHAGARVHVSDSEVANVDVDLLAIVPGALAGTVMRRGQPVANAPFVLVSGKHDGRVTEDGEWINLRTDAAGRFEYFGPADTFGLLLAAEREGTKEPFYVRAAERATTQRGATTAQTFAIASGTLELTVRDAAGRAVPGVQIASTLPETWFPVSDAAGRVVVEATAGPLSLRTLPKSLQSDAARSRYEQELQAGQRREPLATQCLDLGSVIVLADQTTKHEVHLPADWEK